MSIYILWDCVSLSPEQRCNSILPSCWACVGGREDEMVEPLGEVRSAIDVTLAGPRASQVELGGGAHGWGQVPGPYLCLTLP